MDNSKQGYDATSVYVTGMGDKGLSLIHEVKGTVSRDFRPLFFHQKFPWGILTSRQNSIF